MTTPPDRTAPTGREIADLTARLRALSGGGRVTDTARDADERAAFIADKEALLDRITGHAETGAFPAVGYDDEILTHREAAERLTEHGHDPALAQAMVAAYLDDTSREIGASVHQWGMDQHDVDAIAARYITTHCPTGVPAQRAGDGAQERLDQLARWHADDQAQDSNSVDANAAVEER